MGGGEVTPTRLQLRVSAVCMYLLPPPPRYLLPTSWCLVLCECVYGCVWVCMGVYGCVWVCMGVYGCVWVCMGVYGCVCVCTRVCVSA